MSQTIYTPFHYKTSKKIRNLFYLLTGIFWASAVIALLIPLLPHLFYRILPQTPQVLAQTIAITTTKPQTQPEPEKVPLPKLDTNLPKENRLVIPQIGVDGVIHEGSNWEDILKDGIWRVPEYGNPEAGKPIIMAAHRWGYVSWTNTFRRQNSFYNLPNLKEGEEIAIIWNQRFYKYKIYKADSGTEITDYSADLILYTCQLWDSPVRIFRYAKRILE